MLMCVNFHGFTAATLSVFYSLLAFFYLNKCVFNVVGFFITSFELIFVYFDQTSFIIFMRRKTKWEILLVVKYKWTARKHGPDGKMLFHIYTTP